MVNVLMSAQYDTIRIKLLNAIDKAFDDASGPVDAMYVKTLVEALVTLDTVTTLLMSP